MFSVIQEKKNLKSKVCGELLFSSFILTDDVTVQLLVSEAVAGRRAAGPGSSPPHLPSRSAKTKTVRCKSSTTWCGFTKFFYLFIAILCCFINIIKHFYMYTFSFSWYFFKRIGSCELFLGFVLWCDLIYPRVILFVYSRAVPIEVRGRLLICETHVFWLGVQ